MFYYSNNSQLFMLSQKIPNYIALFSENVPKKHANRKYPRKYGHQEPITEFIKLPITELISILSWMWTPTVNSSLSKCSTKLQSRHMECREEHYVQAQHGRWGRVTVQAGQGEKRVKCSNKWSKTFEKNSSKWVWLTCWHQIPSQS